MITINSLIESDNDEDWNVSIKKSESHSQRKSSDPQQVGFKLAEEIRRLKLELANERKEKRMLLVTNENLQEQLKNAEERMKELEAKEFKSARKLSSVVGELQRETINRRSSEEELQKLKNDRKQSKKDYEKSLQQILNTQQKLDEMQKQLIYWKECVGAYESKIKEFVSDKGIREQVLEEQRQRVVSLENSLFKAKSKYLRFKQACLDLLSPSSSRQQAQDKALNLEVNLSVEDELDFDFLMKIIRKKNQVYLESRKNYKNYIHKLIGVVKMYEEMLPSEQFLDDSLL